MEGGALRAREEGSGRSDAPLSQVIQDFDFPLVVWDEKSGIILLVNEATSNLAGVPADTIVGRPITDFTESSQGAEKAADALRSGAVEDVRARRRMKGPGGESVEVLVWTKTLSLNGRRCALTLLATEQDLPSVERDPIRPWRELAPVVIGMLDPTWSIAAVSAEVSVLLGGEPGQWVGRHLINIVLPDDAEDVRKMMAVASIKVTCCDVQVRRLDGTPTEACLMVARSRREGTGTLVFAIVGDPSDPKSRTTDRVNDLELRLRRIGAEVRAAGVLDVLRHEPVGTHHFPQLGELSMRQWEILSRLRRGDRVPTIAGDLYLSPSTVRNHLSGIFRRFDVHSQAELLALLQK